MQSHGYCVLHSYSRTETSMADQREMKTLIYQDVLILLQSHEPQPYPPGEERPISKRSKQLFPGGFNSVHMA